MVEGSLKKTKKQKGELEEALVDISNSLAAGSGNWQRDSQDEKKRSLKDIVCYECSEKGPVKRRGPKQVEVQGQENVSLQLDKQ